MPAERDAVPTVADVGRRDVDPPFYVGTRLRAPREPRGEIWARPGLDRKTRRVRAARRNGLTPDEIGEVLLQCAVYCGVPAANAALQRAQDVLAEEGLA